ncbi:hypothetical protein [Streptomyces tagetis]|uniref:DUF8175 domain-containing protein n=1 Tax=Streptomyces tagetis TaxID=2820809 RepID=A0A940XPD9_9ACTN|nr:hypothetical protein [Streptomyces sp. RG38]MBQ0830777.1 hypothetical protein [Streptomyces sp. RG38]
MSLGDDQQTSGGYGGTGQTRTRLPDSGPEGYPGPRRGGRSSSRSLVTVVGVVVLLIAAIAFANRGGGDSAPRDGASGDKPRTSPTSPTGERPVDTTTHGIPTGHPHTQQGAQSAAANYSVALGSAEMFDKSKRDGILQTVIVPSRVAEFSAALDKAYSPDFNKSVGLGEDGSTPKGYTFVSRTTPIGTKFAKGSADSATVEVWCNGLLGLAGEKSTTPVTSGWFTITMELRWTEGDWKIVTHSQQEGPAPIPGDDRASSSGEMAEAIQGYGGLTYAR